MTKEEKLLFTEKLRLKIKELNELIFESNKDLGKGESRLRVSIFAKEWSPMMDASACRGANMYVDCVISEILTY